MKMVMVIRGLMTICLVSCLANVLDLVPKVQADTTPRQCKQEKKLLVNECKALILGGNKVSANCCKLVRNMHFECVCPMITPKLANLINVPSLVKKLEACGRRVPHNFKCGSITTPP